MDATVWAAANLGVEIKDAQTADLLLVRLRQRVGLGPAPQKVPRRRAPSQNPRLKAGVLRQAICTRNAQPNDSAIISLEISLKSV